MLAAGGRAAPGKLGYDSTDDKGDAAGEMARLGLVNLEDADHAVCRMDMGR